MADKLRSRLEVAVDDHPEPPPTSLPSDCRYLVPARPMPAVCVQHGTAAVENPVAEYSFAAFDGPFRPLRELMFGNGMVAAVKYGRYAGARLPDARLHAGWPQCERCARRNRRFRHAAVAVWWLYGSVAVSFSISAVVNASIALDLQAVMIALILLLVPGGVGFFVVWEKLARMAKGGPRTVLSADLRTAEVTVHRAFVDAARADWTADGRTAITMPLPVRITRPIQPLPDIAAGPTSPPNRRPTRFDVAVPIAFPPATVNSATSQNSTSHRGTMAPLMSEVCAPHGNPVAEIRHRVMTFRESDNGWWVHTATRRKHREARIELAGRWPECSMCVLSANNAATRRTILVGAGLLTALGVLLLGFVSLLTEMEPRILFLAAVPFAAGWMMVAQIAAKHRSDPNTVMNARINPQRTQLVFTPDYGFTAYHAAGDR